MTGGVTAPEGAVVLRFRAVDGREVTCAAEVVSEPGPWPGTLLHGSVLQLQEEGTAPRTVRHVTVPPGLTGHALGTALDEIDSELLAGLRLAETARLNGADPYPPELSRLVGYHDDPRAPFALLEPYRGEPVAGLLAARRLFQEEREAFVAGLLRALDWTRAAGVVHRGVGPDSIRFDADRGQVQLCDFSRATVAGVARVPVGAAPWASHEQRDGTGTCDPRDDLWGAGLVLFQALTGHSVEGVVARGERLPLSRYPDVAERFGALLESTADQRPHADEVLRADRAGGVAPARRTVAAAFEADRAAFRAERRRKHPELFAAPAPVADPPAEPVPADPTPAPRRDWNPWDWSAWPPWGQGVAAGGAVLLLVVLVVALLTGMGG